MTDTSRRETRFYRNLILALAADGVREIKVTPMGHSAQMANVANFLMELQQGPNRVATLPFSLHQARSGAYPHFVQALSAAKEHGLCAKPGKSVFTLPAPAKARALLTKQNTPFEATLLSELARKFRAPQP